MSAPSSRATSFQQAALPDIVAAVRRVIAARVRDRDTVDDLVQEALTRVLEAGPRLDDATLVPYAIVTARNLVVSWVRGEDRRRRHQHRLVELHEPPTPDEELLRDEEKRAVDAALTRLSETDRVAVVAHEVEGTDTRTLAHELESTPGGVAVRLARARARLRVEYLLALRRQEPPTALCRPVLTALSSGDRRRQAALGAGAHLVACAHCAQLSQAVIARRRAGLEGFLPLPLLGGLGGKIARALRTPQVQAATTTVAVCTAAVAFVGLPEKSAPPPTPPAAPIVTLSGRPVDLSRPAALHRFAGATVRAKRVPVQSVPADEGFWVGSSDEARMWVQLVSAGESTPQVRRGERLSFRARVVSHGRSFPSTVGVTRSEGAPQLRLQGVHLVLAGKDLERP